MVSVLDIYADETCQNGHAFLAMGCTLIPTEHASEARVRIQKLRTATNLNRELKWTKVSKAKVDDYKKFIDLYFAMQKDLGLQFHSLVAECRLLDHKRFSGGDNEIGFNKLIYQLISKAGSRCSAKMPFYIYLDSRTTRNGLDELHRILNNGFSAGTSSPLRPFHRVQFRDSKQCDLLQLNDVVLGAVGACKNGRLSDPTCAAHKMQLADHVRQHAGVRVLSRSTPFARNDFRVWNMQLQR